MEIQTNEQLKRTKQALFETYSLLDKELKYSEPLQKKDYIERLTNHIQKLKNMIQNYENLVANC